MEDAIAVARMRSAFIYYLTGWPAVVVRGGTSPEGLPIGVQVVARPWREQVALAVMLAIQQGASRLADFPLTPHPP